jgi:hypothetical protein
VLKMALQMVNGVVLDSHFFGRKNKICLTKALRLASSSCLVSSLLSFMSTSVTPRSSSNKPRPPPLLASRYSTFQSQNMDDDPLEQVEDDDPLPEDNITPYLPRDSVEVEYIIKENERVSQILKEQVRVL